MTPPRATTPSEAIAPWSSDPPLIACAVPLLALCLLARNPDVLLDARFYAEDGKVWYQQAYMAGWRSLLIPEVGYIQTFPRLVALAARSLPLWAAPTAFAAVALLVQSLPLAYLISSRMACAWPCRWARALFAVIMLALPNTQEVFVNLTNAQWHLAMLAFLILVGAPATSRAGRVFDAVVLLISGLRGPFALLLLPIAAWSAVETASTSRSPNGPWSRADMPWRAMIVVGCAVVQLLSLTTAASNRSVAPLGATPLLFMDIIALKVFLAPFLDPTAMLDLLATASWRSGLIPVAACCAGAVAMGAALRLGPPLFRKAALFGGLILAAAMLRPQIVLQGTQWPHMAAPRAGERYFYVPMLVWIGALFVLARRERLVIRLPAQALIVSLVVGVAGDWRLNPAPPSAFRTLAQRFARAPVGTLMDFPLNPPGWRMTLTKHAE